MAITSWVRILASIAMIVFAGAVTVGATGAFFSDTETSTGNTFTAGEIDLTVDSEQHYNGNVCDDTATPDTFVWEGAAPFPVPGTPCDGTWAATDLGVQKFFNFDDVKPGDEGENTISLHIDSNDAWACVDINVTKNDDVGCTESELVGDTTCTDPGTPGNADSFDGDLAQNLDFFAWLDDGATDDFQGQGTDPTEGDNVWQDGELPLFSNVIGPLSDAIGGKTYALADSTTGSGPLGPGQTRYIGLAWCAGEMTTSGPGVLSCNGNGLGDEAQTDSAMADVTFRVEQSRNNPSFQCVTP